MPIYSRDRGYGRRKRHSYSENRYDYNDIGKIICESIENDQILFEQMMDADMEEAYAMNEGTMIGAEIRAFREDAIGSAWDSLKEMMTKLWEKIKEIFNAAIAKLTVWFVRDGKKFVSKIKSLMKKAKNFDFDDVKIPKYYKFTNEGRAAFGKNGDNTIELEHRIDEMYRLLEAVKNDSINGKFLRGRRGEEISQGIRSRIDNKLTGTGTNAADYANAAKQVKEDDDYKNTIISRLIERFLTGRDPRNDNTDYDTSNIIDEAKDLWYEEEIDETFGNLNLNIEDLYDIIKDSSKQIKNLNKLKKNCEKVIKKILSQIQKERKEVTNSDEFKRRDRNNDENSDDRKHNEYIKDKYVIVSRTYSAFRQALPACCKVAIKFIKMNVSQARGVLGRIASRAQFGESAILEQNAYLEALDDFEAQDNISISEALSIIREEDTEEEADMVEDITSDGDYDDIGDGSYEDDDECGNYR